MPLVPYGDAEHVTLLLGNLAGTRTITLTQVTATPLDSGTITAVAGAIVTDAAKSWAANAWAEKTLRITSGEHAGRTFNVIGGTATQLFIPETPEPVPAGVVGETYSIHDHAPVRWAGGSAPTFDVAAGAHNIIVARGIGGYGWICDGGVA